MQTQEQKRMRAKELLIKQLEVGIKPITHSNLNERPYTPQEREEKEKQIKILEQRLAGVKRKKTKTTIKRIEEDEWVIEIYSVKFGYIKNSERRKNKGKSGKKMKKVKTLSLTQTVKNRPGLILQYKNGLMGVSPKNHVFKLVKKEVGY